MAKRITFSLTWNVRMVDTDPSGFAHFSSYLKMMEETEYAFLRSKGLSVVLHDERGILGFPRLSAQIEVIQPLKFGDSAFIELLLAEIDGKQIRYEFQITSMESQRLSIIGHFLVATCRFPEGALPFAILIPPQIENQLLN